MAKSAILSIKILTDAQQAQQGLDQTSSKVGKMSAGLKRAAVPAGIALAAVGAFAKGAGEAASDVQQSMGAVDSVFGDSADQIKAWSDESATSVGLAKSQYGDLAAVLGAQLKNMGVPMDQIAGKTNDLITMGADLAATYGGTTAEAVSALGSALRGETDPIERYGISIKQADIAARQAKDGTAGLEGEAGKAAKTAALLALATEQAGGAMGQFARESDSAAGSQQIATATMEDAQAAIGEALLPAMSKMAELLAKVAGFAKDHPKVFTAIAVAVAALAAAILILNVAVGVYQSVMVIAGAVSGAAWAAALWPILLVIAAIAAVVAIVILVWKNFDHIKAAAAAAWNAIKVAAQAVWTWLKSAAAAVYGALKAGWTAVKNTAVSAWNGIKAAVAAIISWLKTAWATTVAAVKSVTTSMATGVKTTWNGIKTAIKAVIDWLKSAWQTVISGIKTAMNGLEAVLTAPWRGLQVVIETVLGKIQNVINKVKNIHLPDLNPFSTNASSASAATLTSPRVAGLRGQSRAVGAGAGGGATIVIQGAVDPESTARQIRRLLARHDGRVGLQGVLRT